MRNYRRKNRWIRLPGSLLDHVREVAVHGRIVGQLGVKRRHENAALAGHHAFPTVHDERGDGRPQPAYAGSPDEDHLERPDASAEVGLDVAKFEADSQSDEVKQQVQQDMQLAQKVGVRGTPTIFVNGKILQTRSLDGFKQMIDPVLKEASAAPAGAQPKGS